MALLDSFVDYLKLLQEDILSNDSELILKFKPYLSFQYDAFINHQTAIITQFSSGYKSATENDKSNGFYVNETFNENESKSLLEEEKNSSKKIMTQEADIHILSKIFSIN